MLSFLRSVVTTRRVPVALIISCLVLGMLHTDAVFDYSPSLTPQFHYYHTLMNSWIMYLTLPFLILAMFAHLAYKAFGGSTTSHTYRHYINFGTFDLISITKIFFSQFLCHHS